MGRVVGGRRSKVESTTLKSPGMVSGGKTVCVPVLMQGSPELAVAGRIVGCIDI